MANPTKAEALATADAALRAYLVAMATWGKSTTPGNAALTNLLQAIDDWQKASS